MSAHAHTGSNPADRENAGDLPPPENLAGSGEIPCRRFGKTDVIVSAIALGGATFANAKTKSESIRIVQEAVDNGITFMDNAWDYNEGRSEQLMVRRSKDGATKFFS